jgi:hypothetical protein
VADGYMSTRRTLRQSWSIESKFSSSACRSAVRSSVGSRSISILHAFGPMARVVRFVFRCGQAWLPSRHAPILRTAAYADMNQVWTQGRELDQFARFFGFTPS